MKVQYCSDLHLEFDSNADYIKRNPIKPVGDIIILAGDITYLNFYFDRQTEKDFINYLSDNFQSVYLMVGNHEFYGGEDIRLLDKPVHEKLRKNVALVNNTVAIHDSVKIIFSALWSRISEKNKHIILHGMNDFRLIPYHGRKFSVEDFNKMHEHSVQFIQKELKNNPGNQKTVIATHHVPTKKCNSPDFEGSPLNDAFIADLDDLIMENDIDYWIYGHIHRNLPEIKVGCTKLVSNQLGYIHANEYKRYKSDASIEII
ncbi:MAG: metallophosphoesterase [Bacteroidota bacterium]